MKIAVSIPDATFAKAEELARELGTSRSNLYAQALDAFLKKHKDDRLTQSWNDTVDAIGREDDPVIRAGARQALRHTEW